MTSHARDQLDQEIFVTDPRKPRHFLIGFKSRDIRKFEENRWISANPVARLVVVSLRQALVRAVTTLVALLSCPHPSFPTILSPFFPVQLLFSNGNDAYSPGYSRPAIPTD